MKFKDVAIGSGLALASLVPIGAALYGAERLYRDATTGSEQRLDEYNSWLESTQMKAKAEDKDVADPEILSGIEGTSESMRQGVDLTGAAILLVSGLALGGYGLYVAQDQVINGEYYRQKYGTN